MAQHQRRSSHPDPTRNTGPTSPGARTPRLNTAARAIAGASEKTNSSRNKRRTARTPFEQGYSVVDWRYSRVNRC